MFDREMFDEEEMFTEDYYEEMAEMPKSRKSLKDWFGELKTKRMLKKQNKEELHSQGYYSRGDLIEAFLFKATTGITTFVSAFTMGASVVSFLLNPALAPVLVFGASLLCTHVFSKVFKNSITEYKKIREVRKNMKQETKKEKKTKKEKTKKTGLVKSIKNRISKIKSRRNRKNLDEAIENFDLGEPISEEYEDCEYYEDEQLIDGQYESYETEQSVGEEYESYEESVQEEKEHNTLLNNIPNIKLSKTFKNVKVKESNISYVPGIGVYIYPVSIKEVNQQKFFEAGYQAVYEETPMSIETETHKVYVLNRF